MLSSGVTDGVGRFRVRDLLSGAQTTWKRLEPSPRSLLKPDVALQPRVRAALQRAHTGDAIFLQDQRRTGARGFVWSSAEKNDIAIARNLVMARLDLAQRNADRARNRIARIG